MDYLQRERKAPPSNNISSVPKQSWERLSFLQWPSQEAIPEKGTFISFSGKGRTFPVLRHGFHGKLKFSAHGLVQSESEDTVLPLAHFGGHQAWHFEVWKNNVALDGSGGNLTEWEAATVSVEELEACPTRVTRKHRVSPSPGRASTPLTSQGTERPSEYLGSDYRHRFHVSWKP